jgi:hypothetical protein
MSKKVFKASSGLRFSLLFWCLLTAIFVGGCSVAAKDSEAAADAAAASQTADQGQNKLAPPSSNLTKNSPPKGRIEITPKSPADAVRSFYKNLREKRFREAMMMTNLRPAIEPLTDADMQELNADFEPLARQVPEDLQISGEIVTGQAAATVTVKMPHPDTGVLEDKLFNLRREGENWIIITSDEKTEAQARREGRNYFFALRIEVHHAEAQMMLERIGKAQAVHALQNEARFADLPTLVQAGLLADDALGSDSTGYRYSVVLSADKKKYFATAEPAVYGKTGKLSFLLESEGADRKSQFKSKDNKGGPLKK